MSLENPTRRALSDFFVNFCCRKCCEVEKKLYLCIPVLDTILE